MQFRILGPLEVGNGHGGVSVDTPKLRVLLGVLLLHPNEAVSSERLIDELWGERPPATAPKLVQTYVSQLRRELGADAIETRAPGYLLPVGEDDLDAARFRRLALEAHRLATNDKQEQASRVYREALGLWRGPPLADLPFESFARNELERLEDERVSSLMDLIDCELALGRHAEVVPELEALVGQYPLRERPRAQLMLAYYRSGRQADALAVYRETRRTLIEELGIEPGAEPQQLEKQVLTHDRSLEAPTQGTVAQRPPLRRRRTRLRAGAFVLVGALTLAGVLAVALSGRKETSIQLARNHVGFIDAKSGRVTRSIPVGQEPRALVVSGDSVWVANREQTVTRINRETGEPTTIGLGLDRHPTGIAVYRGMIWVWTLERELVPIDPSYNHPRSAVSLAHELGSVRTISGGVAAGGGFLWLAAKPTTVIPVDPSRPRKRTAPIRPDDGVFEAITYHEGQVWVGGFSQVFPISPTSRLPGTGATVGIVLDLAFGEGGLWVVSGAPGHREGRPEALRRVDPANGDVVQTITVGSDPVAVAVAGGFVWVANPSEGTVYRVDPAENNRVDKIYVGASPTVLAADANADGVWVAVR